PALRAGDVVTVRRSPEVPAEPPPSLRDRQDEGSPADPPWRRLVNPARKEEPVEHEPAPPRKATRRLPERALAVRRRDQMAQRIEGGRDQIEPTPERKAADVGHDEPRPGFRSSACLRPKEHHERNVDSDRRSACRRDLRHAAEAAAQIEDPAEATPGHE